ncbi:MAG: hypothetical protein HQM14_14710 [SAR324 cluster bacterium]|nr:hypothetical protein [SAR324 cluster bacterium]
MRKRRLKDSPLGLDSLVDIVSNNVGILVILTVFMALISLLNPAETPPDEQAEILRNAKKIVIPWSHYSQKSSILFLIRDNHILYLDRAPVYQKLTSDLRHTSSPKTEFIFPEYRVDLMVYSSSFHCLDFHPKHQAGEWWHQETQVEKLMQTHEPSEFYFFFWVDSDSFELFHEVRNHLWENNFEVGWKPVLKKSDLRFCEGATRFLSFQPQ